MLPAHDEDMELFESFYNEKILPEISMLPESTINIVKSGCKLCWLKRQQIHIQDEIAQQQINHVMEIEWVR